MKQHNSTEVGGSPEHDPSSAPDVDTLQASPNPITTAALGLKRPSGEGGKSFQQQSHSEYASVRHVNKPRCELLVKKSKRLCKKKCLWMVRSWVVNSLSDDGKWIMEGADSKL